MNGFFYLSAGVSTFISDHFVDINKMVDIGSGADILDNLGSEELGANIFRITQT